MIDTVTFDLWNTLIYTSPIDNVKFRDKRIQGFIEVFKEKGIDLPKEKMEKAYDQSFERYIVVRDKEKDISTREQVLIILDCLGNPEFNNLDEEVLSRLEEVVADAILTELPTLIKGSDEVLSFLEKKKYKIGLICNTGRTPGKVLRKVLKRRKILNFFQALSFSDELKIRKPNPGIFQHTLESLNSSPASALHIGDELESDIFGAKRCGMKAGLVLTNSQGERFDFPAEKKPDFVLPNLTFLKKILR